MLIIILLLFTTISLAQETADSTDFTFQSESIALNYDEVIPLPTSILELKMKRNWMRDSLSAQQNLAQSSTIQFAGKSKNFIDSELFYIIVGSAVAFGAAAAYFKLESDDYYEEYLLTNNKSLKRKTDRYDLYSGIALGAMEINIGILIYKFLTD